MGLKRRSNRNKRRIFPVPFKRTESTQQKREDLLTMDIFRDLEPADIAAFEHQTKMQLCCKDQILYAPGDRADTFFLLKSGSVRLYRLTPSGKRLDLAVIEPGMFFGEMSLLGESRRDTFAEVAEESLIFVMSNTDMKRLMRERPQVALRMIEALSQRLAQYGTLLEEIAYRSVPARIAAVLLRLSQGRSGEAMPINHQELGDMIGAYRESVTRALNEFQRAGVVELSRGQITVLDAMGLRQWLDE
jgi:CRP/FNR family cyclic AMP-dependent transcriptional regulator